MRSLPTPVILRRLCLTLVACTAILVAPPLTAQQRDTAQRATPDTLRPFVRGGIYDKPSQTRLLGRTAIGGYAEAHARYHRVDGVREEAGFEARRFNLFANARVSDYVRFAAELEFEDGAREILLEFAAIDLRIHPTLTLRAGMILSPLGRFNLSHDSPLNEFTDRPLVATEVLGVALSEPGFGILGQVPAGRGGRVTYELYATNGFHDGLLSNAEDGTRIPAGRRNFEDNNGSPALVSRVAWSPRLGFEFGLSAHHGAYNVFSADGLDVDEPRDVTIMVADLEAQLFGVQVNGELAAARIAIPPQLAGIYAERQRGFYLEGVREFGRGLVRTIPASFFAFKVRVDAVDFDTRQVGQSTRQVTAGLNFRPTTDTVLKLDYVRGQSHDRFNIRSDHAFLLASLATYF